MACRSHGISDAGYVNGFLPLLCIYGDSFTIDHKELGDIKYSCPASTRPRLLCPTQRRCCSKNGTGHCSLSPYHIISDEVDASAGSDSPIPVRGMYVEQSGLSRSPCTSVHHHDTNIEAPRPSLIFWHPSILLNLSPGYHNVVFEQFDDAIGTKLYHAIPTPPGAMQQLP